MASQWVLQQEEAKIISTLRDFQQQYDEFTLTIRGFQRSGKRQLLLEPTPKLYLTSESGLSPALDD